MIDQGAYSSQMTQGIPKSVRGRYPRAVDTKFQQDLSRAVAVGVHAILSGPAIGSGGVGLPATGPGTGISGCQASSMTSRAVAAMRDATGYPPGEAFEPIMDAVFQATADMLGTVTVQSTSGFGGQALVISGWDKGSLAQAILSGFPNPGRVKASRAGYPMVQAIAQAITDEVQQAGKPGLVPMAGTVSGPTIVKFS